MNNELIKRWHNNSTWCILPFPKQNKAIVWNDDTKTYKFYEMAPQHIDKKKRTAAALNTAAQREKELHYLHKATWALAGGLGVSLAVILLSILNA